MIYQYFLPVFFQKLRDSSRRFRDLWEISQVPFISTFFENLNTYHPAVYDNSETIIVDVIAYLYTVQRGVPVLFGERPRNTILRPSATPEKSSCFVVSFGKPWKRESKKKKNKTTEQCTPPFSRTMYNIIRRLILLIITRLRRLTVSKLNRS